MYVFLIIISLALSIFAQNDAMILHFNTELSTGTTIEIPLNGVGNINWGDDSIETFSGSGNIVHTYATDGVYKVTISDSLRSFGSLLSNKEYRKSLTAVESWGDLGIVYLYGAFYDCVNLTDVPDSLPETVTNLGNAFYNASIFNDDISGWNVVNVTKMSGMFCDAAKFNQDIGQWNVSNVTNMSFMFSFASSFNQDISNWNVSKVDNFNAMFQGAVLFNQNIGKWAVGEASDMSFMFNLASAFNGDIEKWDVGKVTDMYAMFGNADSFNCEIGGWNVDNVKNMKSMFSGADLFNGDISGWNVGNVNDMAGMFFGAKSFNQDITGWNTGAVLSMNKMFYEATSFRQNIGKWNVSAVSDMEYMFSGDSLPTEIYDSILIGWSSQELKDNVTFHAGHSYYTASAERSKIIDSFKWTISDLGEVVGIKPIKKVSDKKSLIYLSQNNLFFNNKELHHVKIISAKGATLRDISGVECRLDLNKLSLANGVYMVHVNQGSNVYVGQFIIK